MTFSPAEMAMPSSGAAAATITSPAETEITSSHSLPDSGTAPSAMSATMTVSSSMLACSRIAVQAASHQVSNDTVIAVDPGSSIVLQHVSMSSLHASNFLFA
jgi:hypothetical protein